MLKCRDPATNIPHNRYFMRVTVTGKGITPDCKKDSAFWVRNYEALHEATAPIKVGRV